MRLIDADALKESLTETLHRCDEWIENAKDEETRTIAEANYTAFLESILRVKDAPTIDAVPVVRCKECKHWQPSEYGVVEQPYCKHLGYKEETGLDIQIGNENDFCSFGERKDDD